MFIFLNVPQTGEPRLHLSSEALELRTPLSISRGSLHGHVLEAAQGFRHPIPTILLNPSGTLESLPPEQTRQTKEELESLYRRGTRAKRFK